jgi:hypothetical protein
VSPFILIPPLGLVQAPLFLRLFKSLDFVRVKTFHIVAFLISIGFIHIVTIPFPTKWDSVIMPSSFQLLEQDIPGALYHSLLDP